MFVSSTTPGSTLKSLADTVSRHGLNARKSLGQHFLLDPNLCAKIARAAAPVDQVTVLEIGPGPGGLTRALLEAGARRVVAVERDQRCVAALADLVRAWPDRLEIIAADALKVDLDERLSGPVKIVANLPYNVGTALLIRWLAAPERYISLTLMFQKEVAARLTAAPGTKDYGRLSILAQWRCETRRLFDVSAKAFTPPPKVTSTVIQLVPRPVPLFPAEPAALARVTAAAFGQRRKMMRAAMKGLVADPEKFLIANGVDPRVRAEMLEIEKFCALARALPEFAAPQQK
ncbi:MAG: 16S rRNA (adenine(1518)-N(6)/adenine(1519)-N(6))-dimethyltransferase RsmA [Proteobacteria bacterium]|nr:16S rRNA (adenine(1518)-N(6)/adenine(1519)-N(6))-dimethyltransferase RsmA [Pseudomonadota bacterium]MDA1355180.1 16S rRNA (adenine(1518)-N(6)/adenine(1519)-N(6))-dimethyltransferase RsmA [Pseudomonadota bacterium]